ncbi:MAG: hypothetical protein WB755_24870 [Terriglobales bacterium]
MTSTRAVLQVRLEYGEWFYVAGELIEAGERDGNLIKLSFKPNPNFRPPSLEARVFHDLEGEMWVDCKQERLAAFNGHLTQDVNSDSASWDICC